jgi:hypothetical protein
MEKLKSIENFKMIDFLDQSPELIEEYLVVLRYLNPLATKRKIMNMKLKHVEMFKRMINSGSDADLVFIIRKVQRVRKQRFLPRILGFNDKISRMPIIEFFGLTASIRQQLQTIVEAEKNGLAASYSDFKWEQVQGSERMSKFGIYNTLDQLTNKRPHLYKKYMNMNYSEIFTILVKWKTEADIQHEMNQIKTK